MKTALILLGALSLSAHAAYAAFPCVAINNGCDPDYPFEVKAVTEAPNGSLIYNSTNNYCYVSEERAEAEIVTLRADGLCQ